MTTATLDRTTIDGIIEQLEWHWQGIVRPRLERDLTDEAYLWEPVPGCWSLRRRGQEVGPDGGGAGDWVMDYRYPEPEPAPVTTIAWRLGHLAIGIFGERDSAHFGDGSVSYQTTDWPPTAAGGLALLDEHHDAWIAHLREADPSRFTAPCGPAEGPFAEHPFVELVLHLNREALHHGAEILLLLDLFRETGGELARA